MPKPKSLGESIQQSAAKISQQSKAIDKVIAELRRSVEKIEDEDLKEEISGELSRLAELLEISFPCYDWK